VRNQLAVTVLGHDRPGIIAAAAAALAGCGMNLEDSTMTLLRGHFAMTLICTGEPGRREVEAALSVLSGDGLTVDVRELPEEGDPAVLGELYLVTVHGADRLGIVARVAEVVARVGGNITGDLYVLVAEVDLPRTTDIAAVRTDVAAVAAELGVDIGLRPVERDEL
jgi:glycine cleavage system transcriptional repressor